MRGFWQHNQALHLLCYDVQCNNCKLGDDIIELWWIGINTTHGLHGMQGKVVTGKDGPCLLHVRWHLWLRWWLVGNIWRHGIPQWQWVGIEWLSLAFGQWAQSGEAWGPTQGSRVVGSMHWRPLGWVMLWSCKVQSKDMITNIICKAFKMMFEPIFDWYYLTIFWCK